MLKRLPVLFLSLFFLLCPLSASYVIRSYSFDISGKTSERVIRKLITGGEEEKFETLEEAVEALDAKKQKLDNRRVFKNVSYSYSETTEDDTVYLDVRFDIDDARTFLILPYPKYDSNYGARLGLKFHDTNLFGTFTRLSGVAHATLMPWDFDTTKYYTDISISDLLIGDTSISIGIEGSGSQTSGLEEYDTGISVKNIPFGGGFFLNASIGVEDDGTERIYTSSSSFNGLKIYSTSFTPSVSLEIHESLNRKSYIAPSLSINDIHIGNVELDFSDTVKFYDSHSFSFTEFDHSTSLSFRDGALIHYGYSNSLVFKPSVSILWKNTLSYKLSDVTTLYLYENLMWLDEDYFFDHFDTGIGISQKISIGEHITITPTLSEYVRTSFTSDETALNFRPFYTISASASGDYVNWKGNFRDGIMYSFSVSESWIQNYSSRTVKDDRLESDYNLDIAEIQLFKVLWSWLNPSLRMIVNYSNKTGDYGFLYGSSSGELGEYIRGVRNKTITDDGRDKNLVTVVANFNLMVSFPLPSFMEKWMDAYLNMFADYVFTKHGEGTAAPDVARHYFGFGIEGIGVLKDYPSYPVRASLGFDLRKLMQYVNGESDEKDFYEIYIGLGFFF